ncbi:MAG: heparan-alpha-glucosaminide N-acetyltransferase domain-containing protein, partial [Bacteroidota bacterium]
MKRFAPLDIYRGLTICLMIVVNTTGDWSQTFGPLLHAPWHGFTPTDWVFPSFLFAVGTSFAFVKTRWADKPLGAVFSKILKRTLIIFVLGYLLSWFPFIKWTANGEWIFKPLATTRIMGVLQRIALCYFLGALLIYYFSKRRLLWAAAVLLLGYWGLLYFFGDYTLENNFARTLDRWLLGDAHLYRGEGIPFDPEGLLSTLPAMVNVIGGYLTGIYLIESKINYEKLAKLLMVGILLLVGAYVWDLAFPINKKIWTSSYVLLTTGISILVLSLIIYTMEFVKKARS